MYVLSRLERMYDTDIPRLKALRDEYIQKYNENYRWYSYWFAADDPEYPNPKYNPGFWDRWRCRAPYRKYHLASDNIYTIDEIVAVCNRRTDISENERKRDIDCLVYNNVNFQARMLYLTGTTVSYSTTFEEYKNQITLLENDLYPDVLGIRNRRALFYNYVIYNINNIITADYGKYLKIYVPTAAEPATAQPV